MNLQEIETVVSEILIDKLGISNNDISQVSTMKDLGADSLDEVEIIIEIEKKFGIVIPDDDILQIQTIEDLCKYVENKILIQKK